MTAGDVPVKMRGVLLKATVIASLLVVFGPVGEPSAATEDTVELTISNFRYCKTPSCSPDDQGYVRLSSGPVAGADHPSAIIDVPEGSTVTWVYRDIGPGSCDFLGDECPGHDIRFEDGSPQGLKMGYAAARSGPTTVTVKISQPAGTLVRYFCSVDNHYQTGQTGILRVVAPTDAPEPGPPASPPRVPPSGAPSPPAVGTNPGAAEASALTTTGYDPTRAAARGLS